MTRGRGRDTQKTKTTEGTATTGTPITVKRAGTTSGRKSTIAAMMISTRRGAGTTDIQMTAMLRRGKRGITATTTAAVTRTGTDIDGTLITRMDGEVQKTVTHSFVQRAFGALRRTVRLLLVTQLVQTTLVGAGGVVLRTSLHLYAVSFTKVTFYVTQRTSQNNIISMEL